ncbi:family 16 glycosylhydrolase [Algibacter sp. 2305UL17-15]|uniref:family 16 glycosylhydrolase n=1 Tax=Algibacter sp. 2305UL17-15 TaxID=3231268 RepID=UPI003457D44F
MKSIHLKGLFFLICISQFGFSQQMPLGFSNSSDNFTAFGGSGFSTRSNPNDAGDTVAQFFNDGSESWQGFKIDLVSPIDLNAQKNITLDFYAFDPNNHAIMVKLENGINPDVQVTVNDSGSGWENGIAFNFANAVLSSDGVTSINASGTYNRLVIFIDGGSTISGTYLIDDINNGTTPTDPNALDVIYSDLVWADEFNTPGLDNAIVGSKWHHQTQIPAGGNWYNGEQQHYTNRKENSFVENGFLNIVAKRETPGFSDQGVTKDYTSARLNSKYAFTYGRVDVRAKLPSGNGTWPAIWTLGKNINEDGGYWDNQGFGTTGWPACGEIDVMEHGLGAVNHTSSALHTPSSSGNTVNYSSQVLSDVATNFHIYSVNWSPDQITFLVDDVAYYTYNPSIKDAATWPFFEDQYLLLNIAMGGASGAIDPNFIESSMVIDYVRVYQNTGLSIPKNNHGNFEVFPNPFSGFLNIKSEVTIDEVQIYSLLGNLVFHKNLPKTAIDISNLNTGMYLLYVYAENTVSIKKIVKQ